MRKKLFAILMSAMMMVTFMPAMAFADAATGWSADYKYYTYENGTQVASTIYLNKSGDNWDGTFTACVYGQEAVAFTDYSYAEVKTVSGDADATDLTAVTGISKSKMEKIFGTTPESYVDVASLKFTAKYTDNGFGYWILSNTGTTATYDKNGAGFKMETPNSKYDATKKYEDQVLSLAIKAPVLSGKVIGAVPAKSLKIVKESTAPADATYTLNGKNTTVDYTGEEYTLAQTELPGVTSTYYVKGTDGEYTKVDAVKVKDVKDSTAAGVVKAIATDGKTTSTKDNFALTVNPAGSVTFGFEQKDIADKKFYVKAGFNAADYMVIGTATASSDAVKTAADKKAVAANEALLKEYFNDFYVIKTEAKKYDATDITATIVQKPKADLDKLTLAERTALVEKYGNMLKNFGRTVNNTTVATPQFSLVNNTLHFVLVDEIDWVKAPLTKKYYNKKGTLKKTYTFQVEAKADSKVTYTLKNGGEMIKIDKNTGKVTVKKGLKVGTYTVRVTASAGNSTDYYYMTIKMAKKK